MTIASVQISSRAANYATSITATLTGVVAGHFLTLPVLYFTDVGNTPADATNISDSSGNTWKVGVVSALYNCGGVGSTYKLGTIIYYLENASAGTHNVTFTNPTATSNPAAVMYMQEFSGLAAASGLLDQTVSNTTAADSTSSFSPGTTGAIADNPELVVTALASFGITGTPDILAPSGYTATGLDNNVGGFEYGAAWKSASSGGQTVTWDWSNGNGAANNSTGASSCIATFRSSAPAAGIIAIGSSGLGGGIGSLAVGSGQ